MARYFTHVLESCDIRFCNDGRFRYIGEDNVPLSVIEGQITNTLILIDNIDTLTEYTRCKEGLKNINPFVNIKHLQLFSSILIKNLIECIFKDDDDLFDIDGDLKDDIEMSRLIDIKRIPKSTDENGGFYEYDVVKFDAYGNHEVLCYARGENPIVALLICFNKVADIILCEDKFLSLEPEEEQVMREDIANLLEKHEKERQKNVKDLAKLKKDQNFIRANSLDIDYSGCSEFVQTSKSSTAETNDDDEDHDDLLLMF